MFGKSKFLVALTLCFLTNPVAAQQKNLLIYCGITLVRPITELARIFAARENVVIQIAQGGSEDLYQSAKKSRQGDLYLPGEPSYRDSHQREGLLGDYRLVGYNQMAIVVQKNNPKEVKGELKELLRSDLTVILGNAISGSVGQETRNMLDVVGIYSELVNVASEVLPDSRSINQVLKRGEADAALNWRATALFPENAPYLDIVDLPENVAKPHALLLIQLTFSKNPKLAQKFMSHVASEEGQAIFRKYGFLDSTGRRKGTIR